MRRERKSGRGLLRTHTRMRINMRKLDTDTRTTTRTNVTACICCCLQLVFGPIQRTEPPWCRLRCQRSHVGPSVSATCQMRFLSWVISIFWSSVNEILEQPSSSSRRLLSMAVCATMRCIPPSRNNSAKMADMYAPKIRKSDWMSTSSLSQHDLKTTERPHALHNGEGSLTTRSSKIKETTLNTYQFSRHIIRETSTRALACPCERHTSSLSGPDVQCVAPPHGKP